MLELIQNWADILIPLGIFLLILVTGYSLWRIGWSIFDRWADKTQWTGNIAVISTVKTPSFIWFIIIGLAVSLEFSPIPENWASPAGKTLWTILLLSIIWVFIRMGDRVIRIYASKVDIPGPYLMIARRSVLVLLIVVMILTALSIWGAPTNAALLGIAILVLIAFLALRDLLADIFAGLEISASGSIKKRDYIMLSTGEEGYVLAIGIRTTKIKTGQDSVASIANSRLHKTIVTNYGPYSMKPEYDRLREYTNRIETLTQEISSQRDEIGTILSSLAEGILVLNQANEIVSTNPAAASLLDRPDADLIGKRLETYLGFSREDLLNILSKQAQDSTYIVKKRYQKKVYSLNVQSLPGEDERGGRIIVAIHDITEMDRVDQMKTEFVSMVSHELKTPLTSIKGYIDMILDGEAGTINSEQKNYLEVVRSSGEKLMLLVNDLLDISRIEAGKIELKTRPVILNHTINAVVTSMHTQLEAKKIQIKLDFESDPITVMADGMRLNQILTNLLDNACKYTREGSKVIVKARREGSLAHIDVIDSGIGISAEDQARIFTRFYRVDNSLTRKTGGTGLGLSVAKALVDMQGGRMWVQSEPDKGSTFSFSLPLQTVNQPV